MYPNKLTATCLWSSPIGDASQLHLIYPSFEGIRPTLRSHGNRARPAAQDRRDAGVEHLLANGGRRAAFTPRWTPPSTWKPSPASSSPNTSACTTVRWTASPALDLGESEQEAKKVFTQTLFNRLMFVYFVSRKGWLSFGGDRDYLNALWKDYAKQSRLPPAGEDAPELPHGQAAPHSSSAG